jgi:hypothetical protein
VTGESDSGVDIPVSRKRIALALLSHSFSRVAWLILDCARRTGSIYLDPSKLACFSLLERHPCWSTWDRRTRLHIIRPTLLVLSWGWGLIDLPLRATFSPAHPMARRVVSLAHARTSLLLLRTVTPSHPRESPDCPSLRASNEHRFTVRVLRARRMVWWLPSPPSETARCASTEDHQAPSPLCSGSTRPTWVSFQSFYRARSANRRTARLPHPFFSSRLN